MAPAERVLPSMPSEPALSTVRCSPWIFLKLKSAEHGELLVAAAGAGCAIDGDGDFADGDEAEARMNGAQGVETAEQIAGRVGIVPVVATVVDDGVVAGLFGKGAGAFNQVVAGEQNLED